jgi:hypothetical protein
MERRPDKHVTTPEWGSVPMTGLDKRLQLSLMSSGFE